MVSSGIRIGAWDFLRWKDVKPIEEEKGQVVAAKLTIYATLNPEDVDGFLKAWTDDATIMKQQPGFISTQLHRGIAGSTTFINHAVWESVAAYRSAVNQVGIRSRLSNCPDSTIVSPHLFKKIAVPGISEA